MIESSIFTEIPVIVFKRLSLKAPKSEIVICDKIKLIKKFDEVVTLNSLLYRFQK